MKIYPLWLRQRLTHKIEQLFKIKREHLNVPLEYAKGCFMDLNEKDVGHLHIRRNFFYERVVSEKIAGLAKIGGVLFDVGANYGYYSIIWASNNINNKVYAFEASPNNHSFLKENIKKNALTHQVHLESFALGASIGEMNFYLGNEEGQTGWGGLVSNQNEFTVKVKVNTIDHYCNEQNIEKIEVLKIDVEGADTWVLYGAKEMLINKKINHIFFEQNVGRMKRLNIATDAPIIFLKSMGYTVQEISINEYHAYI